MVNIYDKTMSAALAYSFEDLAGFDASNDNVPLSSSIDTGQSGLRTLAYDAQGNVTTLGNLAFLYDYSNQPVVVSGTANGVGAANGAYTYDGNLKRVKSVVNGKTLYNVYDASGSLVHIDAVTDNKKTDYVSGPNGSLARITNNVVTYLHPDHLGSAQSGTNTSGGIAWRERYTPFGEERVSPAANDNLAGFTGHIKDKATGLNYMQARYYDPVIGRFLSIDPVTFMDTGDPVHFNRFAYANNDPINMLDPFGMQACDGVKGGCIEASNFKEKKADTSLNIVASPENDAAVASSASQYAVEGEERGFRVDGNTSTEAGTPGSTSKLGTVSFKGSELSGADAFGHSHDPSVEASEGNRMGGRRGPGTDGLNPGPGDGAATVKAGLANFITHKERAIVIEISGGQARVRTVAGKMNRTERRKTQKRVNSLQRKIQ